MKWICKYIIALVFGILIAIILIIWDLLSLIWTFELQSTNYVCINSKDNYSIHRCNKDYYDLLMIDEKQRFLDRPYKSYWHYWYERVLTIIE